METEKQEPTAIQSNIWVRMLIGVTTFCAILYISYLIRDILIPLFLAFLVAYVLDPVIDWFEKHGRSRMIGIAASLVLVVLLVAGLSAYTFPKMIGQMRDLVQSENLEEFKTWMDDKVRPISDPFADQIHDLFEPARIREAIQNNLQSLESYAGQIGSTAFGIIGSLGAGAMSAIGFVLNVFVFGIVTIYLLRDFDTIVEKASSLIPSKIHSRTTDIFRRIDINLRTFLRGQMTVCLILSSIYSVGLLIFGVPFAIPIGFIGGFGNIIPYIGMLLGLVPACIMALVEHQDLFHLLAAIGVFAVGQLLEGTVITPKIVGDKLGLNPVVVILAILIFGKLMGFLGIILAVPIAAVGKVLVEEGLKAYRASYLT